MAGQPNPSSTIDPFAVCETIARRNGSPLWQVSQALAPLKRRFFNAAYASMRLIDDYVDDRFLALPVSERVATRQAALDRVDHWLKRVTAAAQSDGPAPVDDETAVFAALSTVLPLSDITIEPWQAMARAMRRDVQEQPLQTWQQFLDYCEGATVAPAEVFIHILGSRDNPDRLHCELPKPLGHYARDMAVFCYLVHIIRDLPADAQHTDQLLTVPEDLLSQHDLDKGRLKDALSLGKLEPVVTLAVDLAERARSFRSSALCRQQEMQAHLSQDAYELLGSLFATYESLHDAALDDRTALLKIWATKPVRQEAAKTV